MFTTCGGAAVGTAGALETMLDNVLSWLPDPMATPRGTGAASGACSCGVAGLAAGRGLVFTTMAGEVSRLTVLSGAIKATFGVGTWDPGADFVAADGEPVRLVPDSGSGFAVTVASATGAVVLDAGAAGCEVVVTVVFADDRALFPCR